MKKHQIQSKNRFRLSFSLYLNYVVHGFGLLILSQNMTALDKARNSPLKIVFFVISGIGTGRLLFGFTAASGVMQTGLNAFMRLYPNRKGLATGVFYFFGALASFTVPIITGVLSDAGVRAAFGGYLVVGLIATCLTLTISLLLKGIHLPELTISSHQPESLAEDQ